MSRPAQKRLLLFWLLLLLPALGIGAGSIWLLHREQSRILAQDQLNRKNRLAAVEARSRLIAENLDTLVVDVQNGLMATLRSAPADSPESFLRDWQSSNPFVRAAAVFPSPKISSAPSGSDAGLSAWAATLPWKNNAAAPFSFDDDALAAKGTDNWQLYQNSRANLQRISSFNKQAESPQSAEEIVPQIAPADSGWSAWLDAQKNLHLFGWHQTASGKILTVAVNLDRLQRELAQALPSQLEPDESYALRSRGGHTLAEVGFSSAREDYSSLSRKTSSAPRQPAAVAPLSAQTLPGWSIQGFLRPANTFVAPTFFYTSSLLVALCVLTILGGGALLLRQARRSEAESAQKTSFVANVSHEFKTPLTTIRLYAELLEQERVREPAARADCLRVIARETQRLARLVNNVLDFSRLEQGRKKFARESVALENFLRAFFDRLAPRLDEAGLHLDLQLPEFPLRFDTDPDALEQILLNLIENACKYAAAGGELSVSLRAVSSPSTQTAAEITVADRGPGIPSSQRERVFEKFLRLDNSLTATQGGTGLGLSIARQLARGLGGDLRVAPRPGGGSCFTLSLS